MCTAKNTYILTHNVPHKDSIDFLVFKQRQRRANIYEEKEKSVYLVDDVLRKNHASVSFYPRGRIKEWLKESRSKNRMSSV